MHDAAQSAANEYTNQVLNEGAALTTKQKGMVLFEGRNKSQRLTLPGLMEAGGQVIEDAWLRSSTALMLRNTKRFYAGLDETTKALHVGNFERFSYPIVRAVYPNLIAHMLVSTQPMLGPTSLAFYMKFLYATSKGRALAGQDMIENPDHTFGSETVEGEGVGTGDGATAQFTGNASWTPVRPGSFKLTDGSQVITDDGNGRLTGDINGGGNNTINYGTGAFDGTFAAAPGAGLSISANYAYNMEANGQIPEVDLVLTSTPIIAQPRKLRTKWSVEAGQDLMAVHNISAEVELVGAIANELRFEVDQDIIRDLIGIAAKDISPWSKTPGAGVSYTEHKTTFWDTLVGMSNEIFQKTGRAEMSWIVGGVDVSSVVETMPGFVRTGMLTGRGVYQVGTLNGIPFFKSSYMPDAVVGGANRPGRQRFMVGYRGTQMFETGYVWSPYQMFYTTPVVRLDDFQARRGVATRYGKKVIDSRFYQHNYITA